LREFHFHRDRISTRRELLGIARDEILSLPALD